LAGAVLWLVVVERHNGYVWRGATAVGSFCAGLVFLKPELWQRFTSTVSGTWITNMQRLAIWQTTGKLIRANPWWGVGIDRFASEFNACNVFKLVPLCNHAHNNLLQLTVEFGIVGLSVWLVFFFKLFGAILERVRKTTRPFHQALGRLVIGWFISLAIHGVTDATFRITPAMGLFLTLAGFFLAVTEAEYANAGRLVQAGIIVRGGLTDGQSGRLPQ
jgi:O-antigen ligase